MGARAGAVAALAAVGAVPVMAAAKPFSRPPKSPPRGGGLLGDGLLVVDEAVLAVAGGAPPAVRFISKTLSLTCGTPVWSQSDLADS